METISCDNIAVSISIFSNFWETKLKVTLLQLGYNKFLRMKNNFLIWHKSIVFHWRLTLPFFTRWIVDLDGAPGTLFEGEKFQLGFKFGSRYPFDSPQVNKLYYFGDQYMIVH